MVSVLFADLVGFTSLSEGEDPETMTRLVDGAFERLVRDVHTFGGRVDKIVGDAIVALFGAPIAHEDDAERAVRAAIRMRDTLAGYASESSVAMRIRIGVNTGEVLVGALRAGGDYTAMGDVVNVASRLQTSAEPGEVLVGESTRVLTDRAISYAERGAILVRGREQPVEVFVVGEVLRAPGYRRRRTTPLVGRDPELALLDQAVELSVNHRRGQVILILGEAGVGKTRLATAVQSSVHRLDESTVVLSGRCVPYGEANPWWPVAEAVRQACGLDQDDPLDVARARVTAAIADLGIAVDERPSTVNGLLHVLGQETSLRALDPARARTEANQALLAFLEAGVRKQPIAIRLADLHWADEQMLELIDSMSQQLARLPFVLIGTARRALLDRWSPRAGRHNVVVLNLDALNRDAAAELLDALIPADTPDELRSTLLDRSGGNPFYLEELARLVAEHDADHELVATEIPGTLRGLLAARIDALTPAEQGAVEDAAVWGSSGPLAALSEIARRTRSVEDLGPVIKSLVAKDVVVIDDDQWSFRSDVIREIAYARLTRLDRFYRHFGIADYLDRIAGGRFSSDLFVETIARHYGAAALLFEEVGRPERGVAVIERAVHWLAEAARRADAGASWLVAERWATQALALAPPGGGDDATTFTLLLARAHARAESWSLVEARADAVAAAEVAVRLADPLAAARVQLTLGEVAVREGRDQEAVELLDAALATYLADGDVAGQAQALRLIGMASLFRSDFVAAEEPISRALVAFVQAGDRRGEAWALQNLAWIAFIAGRIDEADERIGTSITAFEEIGDLGGMAWARGLSAFVRMNQGRFDEARAVAESVLEEGGRRRDRWGQAMMMNVLAAIDLWEGRTIRAAEVSGEAVRLLRILNESVGLEQALAIAGRANVMAGHVATGMELLTEGSSVRTASFRDDGIAVASRIATCAQLGLGGPAALAGSMPLRLDDVVTFGLEHRTSWALVAAQRGELDVAVALLNGLDGIGSSYAAAVAALVGAAAGDDRVEVSLRVGGSQRPTYLDELYTAIALALTGGLESVGALERAEGLAGVTSDVTAVALAALACAVVAEADGVPDATERRHEADARWSELGVDPVGWRRLFDAAISRRG